MVFYRGSFAKGVTLINYASLDGCKRERKKSINGLLCISYPTTHPSRPIRRLNGRYIFWCVFIYLTYITSQIIFEKHIVKDIRKCWVLQRKYAYTYRSISVYVFIHTCTWRNRKNWKGISNRREEMCAIVGSFAK